MKVSVIKNLVYVRPIKRFFKTLAAVLLACFSFTLVACKKEISYFDYVSELRSNIFLAEADGFYLRVYAVEKESPYATDGIKRETSPLTEIRLTAPSGDQTCNVSFTVNETVYGGEMSFDNVKTEYYYFCTLDVSALKEIEITLVYGEKEMPFTAKSVRSESTLAPEAALKALQSSESELFTSLTDDYGFAGEIYLRLIYEDSPYYYVGVIDRKGNVTAFLMNAQTGKVLAKRQA